MDKLLIAGRVSVELHQKWYYYDAEQDGYRSKAEALEDALNKFLHEKTHGDLK